MRNPVRFECQNVEVDIPEDDIVEYVKKTMSPADVFDDKELDEWAIDNGYKKEIA